MSALKIAVSTLVLMFGVSGVAHAGDKHLFYMHGCCLEKVGEDDYNEIVNKLKKDGFKVHFETRYDDSVSAMQSFAEKITGQVKALIASGTAPEDITVAGFSLGSVISMLSAVAIDNPKVNYVLLAGCPGPNAPRKFDIDFANIHGRVLSITDRDDDRFGTCGNKISNASEFKEITIETGSGHKGFRYSDYEPMKAWKEPLEAWAGLK